MNPPERRPICGTYRGHQVHYRAREDSCRDCLDAFAAYQQRRRRKIALGLPIEEPGWLRLGDDLYGVGAVLRRGWLESA